MRLPSWHAKGYDTRISEGWIGVCVHCSADNAQDAEELLRDSGAADIRRDARRLA